MAATMNTTNNYDLFDAAIYNARIFDSPKTSYYYRPALRNYHNFWKNLGNELKVMEFGGGPTIYSLVSACTHAKGITFCEYNKNNRAAVSAWLEKKKEAFDWSNLFEYIVCELEGKSKDEALKRQDELREKIKIILPCDVKEDDIVKFPEGSQDTRPPFDVVSSSLCLEVAVESDAEYEMVVAKLANFVKPGGYLIMQGVLNESHYTVNGVMFHSFPLTKELIVRSIEMAGMTGIEFKKHECKDDSKDSDHDGLYFVSGVKV